MNDAAIAAMIREVLAEEVEKIGGKKALRTVDAAAPVREESVSIETDQELAEFVRRILTKGCVGQYNQCGNSDSTPL